MIGRIERWWGGWGSGPGPTDPAGWRARLTEDLIRMLVLSNLVVIGIVMVSYRFRAIPLPVLLPIVVCVTGMLALLASRGPRLRATILVVGLALTAGTLFALQGPSASGFIALFTACVLTVLLLGTWAGAWSVMLASLIILASPIAEAGLIPRSLMATPLPGGRHAWLQLGLVWLACTSSVVLSVAWLTHQFTEALTDRQTALESARHSNEEREASDHRRVDTENALIEAQRHETLGRMVGGVSHDFNNAMFVILGWNDLLSRGEASAEQVKQAHAAIAAAARNASALAKRMDTISREESDASPTASLESVAREAVSLLDRLLPEHIRIEAELQPVPAIAMDPMRLQQMIFDLALAARDRMPEGGRLQVVVGPDASPDGTPRALLTLQYEPRESRSFAPMSAQEASPTVVRAILDRVGGTLSHRRTPSGAWAFEARFPILAPEASPPSPTAPPRVLRILLVEDDPAVRQIMTMALRQRGHIVREAGNGDEAMRMLERTEALDDLLCMDAIIPGTPSAEVIERFRTDRPDAPVLVCSGHVASAALARLIREERLPFLPKPFGPETLVNRIEQLARVRSEPLVEQEA